MRIAGDAGNGVAGAADAGADAEPSPRAASTGFTSGDRWIYPPDGEDIEALLDRDLARIVSTGATGVRLDIRWSIVAAGGPNQAQWDWSSVDRQVNAARAYGLKILGMAMFSPAWARPAGSVEQYGPSTTSERNAYGAFLRAAATRYRTSIGAWELWNEQNLDGFWTAPNPESYAAMVKVAGPKVKLGNPLAVVITGGTDGAPEPSNGVDLRSVDFVQRMLAVSGVTAAFDAVGVHPYPSIDNHRPNPAGGEMHYAQQIKTLVTQAKPGAQLWPTETGANTNTAETYSVSEADQAALMPQLAQQWTAISSAPMFYYILSDSPEPGAWDKFGVFRANGTTKKSYGALRKLLHTAPVVTWTQPTLTDLGTSTTATAELDTEGAIEVDQLLIAVRDSAGNCADIPLTDDTTLTGTAQTFTATVPIDLPPGALTYWIAYRQGTTWTELQPK